MEINPNSFEFQLYLFFNIALVVNKLILAIYLGRMMLLKKKETGFINFDFTASAFIFFVCYFIGRLFFIYLDFFLTNLDTSKNYLMPNIIFWKIGVQFRLYGLISMIFMIERAIMNFKLKGIPSIIIVILILIVFIYPVNTIEDFEFLSLLMLISAGEGLFIVLSFFYIGIKIPGLRKIAFFCAFGTFIYAIGTQLMQESLLVLLRATFGIQSQILFYFTHVCVQIIGLILFSYGISNFAYSRRKSKQESVKKTSTPLGIKVEESKISLIETLSQSKPAEITQDQVSLYREQNVCLVCKGQLNRYDVYLCPKCKVLYCENCAHSLENLENQCWVCGEPIDKSKPVKLSKEQEEDIKIK